MYCLYFTSSGNSIFALTVTLSCYTILLVSWLVSKHGLIAMPPDCEDISWGRRWISFIMSQVFIGNEFRIYWGQNADSCCTKFHAGSWTDCIEGFEALRIRPGPLIGYHLDGCFRSTLNRMERPGRQDKIQSYLQKITKSLANGPIASWQVPNVYSTYPVNTPESWHINNGRTANKEFWIWEPGTRNFEGSFFETSMGVPAHSTFQEQAVLYNTWIQKCFTEPLPIQVPPGGTTRKEAKRWVCLNNGDCFHFTVRARIQGQNTNKWLWVFQVWPAEGAATITTPV